MKIKGIPFIFNITTSENGEISKGIMASAAVEYHRGSYRGALIGGLVAGTDKCYQERGDLEGIALGGFFGIVEGGDLKGGNIGGLAAICCGNAKGVVAAGGVSYVKDELSGFSYGSVANHARTNGGIAIQIGAINNITEYNPNGTTIQLGIYNRSGEQSIPIVNIRGIRNLFKARK